MLEAREHTETVHTEWSVTGHRCLVRDLDSLYGKLTLLI